MKRPPYYLRIPILIAILCFPPIGSTQLGWYFFGKEAAINIGMVVGFISVTLAMAVVLYLGVTSIMKGFTAKQERRLENEAEEAKEIEKNEISSDNQNGLSSEINKLNELYKSGALSKEEFDKAKAKLLEN